MRSTSLAFVVALGACSVPIDGFSMMTMKTEGPAKLSGAGGGGRRDFMSSVVATSAAVLSSSVLQSVEPVQAAPTVYNLPSGIKYAITKDVKKGTTPQNGDIVAIEYTGYLSNGQIFDGTHSEGKQNNLMFQLGTTATTAGINDMVSEMKVGQKVQAIIPPELAFGDKGICLENGECLVKPKSTLVYDIYLKKSSIPPP